MTRAVVVGGTFAGVSAACALAERGVQVTLIDAHTFLGGDIVASRHTWLVNGEEGCRLDVPNGRTKMELYAMSRDVGVELLLAARVCGVMTDGSRACGVAFATKYGIFEVPADLVLDATEAQVCAYHLTGRRAHAVEAEFGYDMSNVSMRLNDTEAMPETLGLLNRHVLVGNTAAEYTVNVCFRFPVTEQERNDRQALERHAHELMVKSALCLRGKKGFEQGCVSIPASHTRLFYDELPSDPGIVRIDSLLPAVYTSGQRRKQDEQAARTALDSLRDLSEAGNARELMCAGRPVSGWRTEWNDRENLHRVYFDPCGQGFRAQNADVLVAGAGTGGAMAGWACAMRGVDVLALDQVHYCGGTNTVGRVFSAWHGYVDGMFAERMKEVAAQNDSQAMLPRVGAMMMWERMFGKRMLGGLTVCGAGIRNGSLQWVLACGEDGFQLFHGDYVIDGTADGDVCALAGLPFTVGGGRDGILQTSSMWGYETQKAANFTMVRYNSDEDMIDPDSYRDLLRGFGLGYRHNSEYEIVEMCMQRESRRFDCLRSLTMAGIARRTCPDDTIAVGYCRHDTHGISSSLLNRFQLFSRAMNEPGCDDVRIRIPFGMFLPVGIDNVAIVGKSMSGEREAVNLCRMNPDLSNAAFAAGWMVAHAVQEKVTPLSALDVREGQKELASLRILPEWAMRPGDALGVREALELLKNPEDGGFASMMQDPGEIVPRLLEYLGTDGVEGDNAALALGWHGCPESARRLTDMLYREEERDIVRFERRGGCEVWGIRKDGFERIVNPNETYGNIAVPMDDPDFSYSRINRLLVLIGLSGGGNAEDLLALAARVEPGELLQGKTPYSVSRIDTHHYCQEERLWALGHAFERIGDPCCVRILDSLLDHPGLAYRDVSGTGWKGVTPPRAAFTELMLARAAAHCGSRKGAMRLVRYLADQRAVFAGAARRGLEEVYGTIARTQSEWEDVLNACGNLNAKPYRGNPYWG